MDDPCLCTSLRQAAARSTAFYDDALAPAGIRVTMFRLLRRIARAQQTSITDLAAALGLDRSTLGRNLRVLERQALIVLQAGADERIRLVALTAKGHATLDTALPLWRAAQRDFAAIIGPDAVAVARRIADQTPPNGAPR